MKIRRVVFGRVKSEALPAISRDSGFTVSDDSYVYPAEQGKSRPVVSPRILKLVGLALAAVCLLQLFASPADSSPPPIEEQIKAEKIIQQYKNYRARLRPDEKAESVEASIDSVQKQIHAVARAEAVGNKALARQELNLLMMSDGGDTRSPIYKFCVGRFEYYR